MISGYRKGFLALTTWPRMIFFSLFSCSRLVRRSTLISLVCLLLAARVLVWLESFPASYLSRQQRISMQDCMPMPGGLPTERTPSTASFVPLRCPTPASLGLATHCVSASVVHQSCLANRVPIFAPMLTQAARRTTILFCLLSMLLPPARLETLHRLGFAQKLRSLHWPCLPSAHEPAWLVAAAAQSVRIDAYHAIGCRVKVGPHCREWPHLAPVCETWLRFGVRASRASNPALSPNWPLLACVIVCAI